MIETVGALSVNLTLSERGTPAGSKSEGQITGRIHFTTTVLSSRIAAADTTPATPLTRVRPTQPGETPPPLPPTITIPSSPAVTIAPPPPPPPSLEAVAPPPQGFEPLGPDYHGWGLSGGETLRLLASPDSEECRSQCEHEAEACKAYNWVKPGGYKAGDPPACYLMRSYQSASPSPCCVSATRGPFPR